MEHPQQRRDQKDAEVAMYRAGWTGLAALAVHGQAARALITRALDALIDTR